MLHNKPQRSALLLFIALCHTNVSPATAPSTFAAPTGFEENKGQVRTTSGDAASFVRYRLSQGSTHIFLLESGIAYQFNRTHYPEGYTRSLTDVIQCQERRAQPDALQKRVRTETYRMDMLLEGANTHTRMTTEGKSRDYTRYYNHSGSSPEQPVPDVYTYTTLTYHDVYPGIDWVLYTTKHGMKYDFIVHPGADPGLIRMRFEHQEELYVDGKGGLVHGNRMGRFTEKPPVSYQGAQEISTRFVLERDRLSFAVGSYDRSRTLRIDPDRTWGTYYGAEGDDEGFSCAVDSEGNVYMAGTSQSATAIATAGHQNTHGGGSWDAFLVKFNADGVRQWGSYYGGSAWEAAYSCAVDGAGNVYLAGSTESTTSISGENGHQSTHGGGGTDAFLVKFDANGTRLWGTYYGGWSADEGRGCAVDESGNVYLTGSTTSPTGIAEDGHQDIIGLGHDGFLVKFNTLGIRQWGTYYGGTGLDQGASCAVDGSGNVYLAGYTTTHTGNAIAQSGHQVMFGNSSNPFSGTGDAFLAKFNASGVRQWGTYYGGTGQDRGTSCAVDLNGNVYLAGSSNTPTSAAIAVGGHQNNYGGGNDFGTDAFLAKFNTNGVRQWGTYYGAAGVESGSCAVDGAGNVYLAGVTESTGGIAESGQQNEYGGGPRDAFLVKFDADGARLWGTYYGGEGDDYGHGCAVNSNDNVYLAGQTSTPTSTSIATGGHQNNAGGSIDAFLVGFNGSTDTGFMGYSAHAPSLLSFPNPTSDRITLVASQASQGRPCTVYDVHGRQVLSQHLAGPSTVLRTEQLSPGTYVIVVMDSNGHRNELRFMKE